MKISAIPLTIALSCAFTAHWYLSPYIDGYKITAAVKDGNVEVLERHIDTEKIKANLRKTISKSMGVDIDAPVSEADSLGPLGTLGKTVVISMVDSLINPKTVMHFLQAHKKKEAQADKLASDGGTPRPARSWASQRNNANETVFIFTEEGDEMKIFVTLQRYGWSTWKITDINIPLHKFATK